jgi:hypothetical protein
MVAVEGREKVDDDEVRNVAGISTQASGLLTYMALSDSTCLVCCAIVNGNNDGQYQRLIILMTGNTNSGL